MKKYRILIAMAAVGIHICIGSVYAWSVLAKPVMQSMHITFSQTTLSFSIAIFFLGMSACILGRFVEQIGPVKSGRLSAYCFSLGMIGTAAAIYFKSLLLLYIFYGFIGGIGLGVGYITPVSTLIKWFPNHRGFATGLAIMGFGFASLIAGPVMQYLIEIYSLESMFMSMGILYFLIIYSSSSCLRAPRIADGIPALTTVIKQPKEGVPLSAERKQMTRKEAIRTWQFYALWGIFFINITCGIGLLAVVSPMAQELVGMSSMEAASLVGVIGLVNGGGRIGWSSISDWIGRSRTYICFFLLQIIAFILLSFTRNIFLFQSLVFIIISCYGGGFSCMPAFISDIFGVKQLSSIHGSILTAWGIAGIVGPVILTFMKEITGSYMYTLQLFAGMLFIAFLTSLILHREIVDE